MSRTRVPGVLAPWITGLVLFTLLAGGATAYLARPRAVSPVPQSVLDARRESATAAAQAITRSLNGGLSSMAEVATVVDESLRQRNRALLIPFRARIWKSLYVLDQTTRTVIAQVGEPAQPAVLGEPLPKEAGMKIAQVGTTHQIVQYTPVGKPAEAKYLLVGHYDPNRLSDLLTAAGAEGTWLVDRSGAAIVGVGTSKQPPEGFVPPEADPGENAAGSQARQAGDRMDVLAWASLTGRAPANGLGWSVVSAKPVTDVAVATDDSRRRAITAGTTLAALVVVVFAALFLVVQRPIRRLRQVSGEPAAPAPKYGEAGRVAQTFAQARTPKADQTADEELAGRR
ncbi:hypothetical protein [Lentzea nigeriaca]|uniref:hypothetical protein n=1 Tax=Lentzea nigeriaca TaxID=1128665 RepID=UPI00195C79F3|nr:hypothetical protein [Lentzea nigeriaca]MBM7862373.1 hypothetical protein [Lentzea nigeriaca]